MNSSNLTQPTNKGKHTHQTSLDNDIASLVKYLSSDTALSSLELDPYWPKWDSPWWHISLLNEMGMIKEVPNNIIEKLCAKINSHYLHYFPLMESDIPEGKDPYRHIFCHCSLASLYKILFVYGIYVDKRFPWMRSWILKYQLPDGGLNCDEAAYINSKKSSIVSTMPPLEVILNCTINNSYTNEELNFLDLGAKYLIDHQLYKRKSNGEVIDLNWTKLCFPRFYEYDILRGLSFLNKWSILRGIELPKKILDIKDELINRLPNGAITEREVHTAEGSLNFIGSKWVWSDQSKSFPLLDKLSEIGVYNKYLDNELQELKGESF